ncbi:MAG: 2-dehydropantoate 2-reductase N-terminal domain-containing protein, partial [Candidatus Micrarchaeia archaeon]
MKIAVIGLGFVGLVTAVVLAGNNNEVIGIDIDENKIKKLKNGELYIYEPNLKELFIKNKHNLKFYSDYNHIKKSEVAFICVPTPTINNKIELSYVRDSVLSVNE